MLEKFASMAEKRKWVVLLYYVVKEIPRLSLIPLGVKEERDRLPQWI